MRARLKGSMLMQLWKSRYGKRTSRSERARSLCLPPGARESEFARARKKDSAERLYGGSGGGSGFRIKQLCKSTCYDNREYVITGEDVRIEINGAEAAFPC